METSPDRIIFLQSPEWDRRHLREHLSPYHPERCCFCFRPVKPDAQRLMLTRDDSGEWYVVVPPGRALLPDEKTFEHFTLPIGPDCLKRHLEFRPGLVDS